MTEGTRVHAAGLRQTWRSAPHGVCSAVPEVRCGLWTAASFDVDPGEVFCIAGESGGRHPRPRAARPGQAPLGKHLDLRS